MLVGMLKSPNYDEVVTEVGLIEVGIRRRNKEVEDDSDR